MKKLLTISLIILTFVSCKKEETVIPNHFDVDENGVMFTMSFSPYQMSPMKNVTNISSVSKRLDVYIVDLESSDTISFHQVKSDNNYGNITTPLQSNKTYHLYAVAHNITSGIATLNNGIVAFPGDTIKQILFIDTVFSPANTWNLNLEMYRIVGMFRMRVTDALPSNVAGMRYTVSESGNRWNVEGYSTNRCVQLRSINSAVPDSDGSTVFNIYIMGDNMDDILDVNIEARAVTSTGENVEVRQFNNVPIKNGYITQYTGTFFVTFSMGVSMTVGDWNYLANNNF